MTRVVALVLLNVVVGCAGVEAPPVRDGVADLRTWDFGASTLLSGRWAFYWEKLVASDPHGSHPPPDAFVPLTRWPARKHGFASYEVTIRLPEAIKRDRVELAIGDEEAETSHSLVVRDLSGRELGRFDSGEVGATPRANRPLRRIGVIHFSTAEDLIVTLYVANYEIARGGAWLPPRFGTAAIVDRQRERSRRLDFLMFGVLLLMGLHHLAMFALRRTERAPLWFGLFSIDLALRTFIVRRYFEESFPDPRVWSPLFRADLLTLYLAVPLLAAFFGSTFERYFSRRLVTAFIAISLPFIVIALVTPIAVVSSTALPFEIFMTGGIVVVVALLTRAFIRERDSLALLVLVGFILFAAAVVYDVLRRQGIMPGAYALHYGFVVFIFSQSLLIAAMNDRARRQAERSTAELQQRNVEVDRLNETLRNQIGDRSQRLQEALLQLAQRRQQPTLAPGDVLGGRYRLDRLLGTGGMGTVFAATRLADGHRVAIKIVKGAFDPATLSRFAREAALTTQITHPNVIRVYDVDVTPAGEFFLVLELVEGSSLEQHRARFGDVAWALPILRQIAAALAAIHAQGIIHRDVKPSNILVTSEGVSKLADFGVASLRTIPSGSFPTISLSETLPAQSKLTQAGALVGSPLYMAPELLAGAEHATSRSDLFGFGLIAYEMLSGRAAFTEPVISIHAAGKQVVAPPRLDEIVPTIGSSIAEVFAACISIDPAARPTSNAVLSVFDEA